MLVQWCLKGIPETATFDDKAAKRALASEGLTSNWVRVNGGTLLSAGLAAAYQQLSDAALAAHVNAYWAARAHTPYLSLTAGVVERDPSTRTAISRPAWKTALDF